MIDRFELKINNYKIKGLSLSGRRKKICSHHLLILMMMNNIFIKRPHTIYSGLYVNSYNAFM